MFKSLFAKKNKSVPRQPVSSPGSTAEQSQEKEYVERPLDQVLEPFLAEVNPWDPEDYIVPVAEVEYLWARFQQLGPDTSNSVSNEVFQEQPCAQDPFVEQVWRTIPRNENGDVTFPSFAGIIKWWHTSPLEVKIRSMFKLLNRSKPLDLKALEHVLTRLETNPDQDTIKNKAELLMARLDDKNQGFIDEEQWAQFVLQLPQQEINNLVTFHVLPPDIRPTTPNRTASSAHSPIPNDTLIDIASRIGEKDWAPLAYQLGFTKNDVKNIQQRYPARSREQVYQMLLKWRQKKMHTATPAVLKSALINCRMDDAAGVLMGA